MVSAEYVERGCLRNTINLFFHGLTLLGRAAFKSKKMSKSIKGFVNVVGHETGVNFFLSCPELNIELQLNEQELPNCSIFQNCEIPQVSVLAKLINNRIPSGVQIHISQGKAEWLQHYFVSDGKKRIANTFAGHKSWGTLSKDIT